MRSFGTICEKADFRITLCVAMNTYTRALFVFLSLLACAHLVQPAHADYEILQMDENLTRRLLPAHFINHMGFELPKESTPDIGSFGNPSKIYPMFPFYKGKFGGKKFLGVKVPMKYFNPNGRRISPNFRGSPSLMARFYGLSDSDFRSIRSQMAHFEVEKGVHLYPVLHGGDIYGIRSDYSVQYVNSTSVGISFGFGGSKKVVNFGKSSKWGFHARIGFSPVHLGGVTGINLASSINDLFEGMDLILDGDNAESVIDLTLKLTPYLQYQLLDNFNRPKGVSIFGELLPAEHNGNVKIITTRSPQVVRVPQKAYSSEYQNLKKNLFKKIDKEIEWKGKVAYPVQATPIYPDPDANRLIQRSCDHLAKAYEIPESLWPRCRIAATMVPNAWAYPGGDIFFSAGLIGILSKLDSLMFIAGHEIGHVFSRHTTRMLPKYDAYTFGMNALGMANTVFSMSGGFGKLGSVNFLNWFYKAPLAGQMAAYPSQVVAYAGAAGLMSFSRDNERQSDRVGHETSIFAGVDPSAIEKGWADFMGYFKKYVPIKRGWLGKLLASHPDGDERLADIKKRHTHLYQKAAGYEANSIPEIEHQRYEKLHELMKGYTHAYGEYLKGKIEEAQRGLHSLSRSDELFIASFGSSASQCVFEVFDLHHH